MKDQTLREVRHYVDLAIFKLEKVTCSRDDDLNEIVKKLVAAQADLSHEISIITF